MNAITTISAFAPADQAERIALLDAASETPGGYCRRYLAALSKFAQAKLNWNAANAVATDGKCCSLTELKQENREREDRRLRGIIAECTILLTGTPVEFEDAAFELDHWLSADMSDLNGQAAREAGRAA